MSDDTVLGNFSANFISSKNYRIISNDINLNGNENFSISCWAKLTASQSYQPLFWLGDGVTSHGFCLHGGSANRLEGGNGTNTYDTSVSSSLSLNQWTFLTHTWDGTKIRRYINGELKNTLDFNSGYGSTLKRLL